MRTEIQLVGREEVTINLLGFGVRLGAMFWLESIVLGRSLSFRGAILRRTISKREDES